MVAFLLFNNIYLMNKGSLFCFVVGGVHQLGLVAFGLAVQKFLNIE
jgi:hypothetical protein